MDESMIDLVLLATLVVAWLLAVATVGWTLWRVVTIGDEPEEVCGGVKSETNEREGCCE